MYKNNELILSSQDLLDHFHLAGRRCLILGNEDGTIDEIWCYPLRLFYDLEITFNQDDIAHKAKDVAQQCQIRPESVQITYKFEGTSIKQMIMAALDDPGGLMRFDIKSNHPTSISCQFRSDPRLMWPYPADIHQELQYAWDRSLQAFLIKNPSEGFSAILGADNVVDHSFDNHNKLFNVTTDPLRWKQVNIAFSGSERNIEEAVNLYRELQERPKTFFKVNKDHFASLQNDLLDIKSPDPEFNEGYKWAKVGVDRCFVKTPGVGSGFIGGYASTGESEFTSGRPGYAWYFARDSVWTGFSTLGYGNFDSVRHTLELLIRYQDCAGKIPHEITTSGVAHHDAADSTPLFIVLMDRYVRFTGDVDFLYAHWKSIQKALDFLLNTDQDGDGLIENSGIGHGWVEDTRGGLAPTYVSFYLAGIWAKALSSVSNLASVIGKDTMAKEYLEKARATANIVEESFWSETKEFFSFSKNQNGSFKEISAVTASVPIYFGIGNQMQASKVLKTLASNDFTSDWGVRFIGKSNLDYNPTGYHQGTVWPLFTGWVALAEYRHHRPIQGFLHLMNNLLGYKYWAKGYIDEVYHGSSYQSYGVCFHQAWSEAMILSPIIEGVLGYNPNVPDNHLEITPHLPGNWSYLEVKNLRFGSERITIDVRSLLRKLIFNFRKSSAKPVHIKLSPGFLTLTSVSSVKVNGRQVDYRIERNLKDKHVLVEFDLIKTTNVEINYDFSFKVVPPIPHPKPGDKPMGIRLLDVERLGLKSMRIMVEGPRLSKRRLSVIAPNGIKGVKGADIRQISQNNYALMIDFRIEDNKEAYIRKKVIISSY